MKQTPKKRVFIVHGYKSSPTDCWFPWIKEELMRKGFLVFVPEFPDPESPSMKQWIHVLEKEVGIPDQETYFIGHSLGVIAIIRYIEGLGSETKLGGAIFVAGRVIFHSGRKSSIQGFFEDKIRWSKVKRVIGKVVGIYSIDDPFVSTENGRILEKNLNAKLVLEKNKGHFSRDDGVVKVTSVLKSLLDISR